MKTDVTFRIISITFFGLLGSIIVGYIFFNSFIFTFHKAAFQFVTSGFIVPLLFGLFKYKSVREQIYTSVFLLIIYIILTGKALSLTFFMRDLLYMAGLFISVKIYYLFINKYSYIRFYLRAFALALILGIISTLFVLILAVTAGKTDFLTIYLIYSIANISVLVGFGTGVGIDFYLQNKKFLSGILRIKTV